MKLTLNNFDEEAKRGKGHNKNWIKVGLSTCGIAAGADVAFDTIKKVLQENHLNKTCHENLLPYNKTPDKLLKLPDHY